MSRKNISIGLCLTILMAFLLSGCNLTQASGLTDEEEGLVAEYAAGVLMRYGSKQYGGLGNYKPKEKKVVTASVEEENTNVEAVSTQEAADSMTGETVSGDKSEKLVDESAGTELASGNIADAIGLEGFDIQYSGYEISKSYGDGSDGALFFSMDAPDGYQYLIMHFTVTNTSAEDKLCDPINHDVKYRALINDTKRVNEQMTALLNDLLSYSEVIPAGESVDTILLFSLDDETVKSLETFKLIVANTEGEITVACE